MESAQSLLNPITKLLSPESWPTELAFVDGQTVQEALSDVYFTDYELISLQKGIGFEITIVITRELSVEIPGLQGTKLVLGGASGAGMTSFRLVAFLGEEGFELWAEEIQVALRFPPSILKPVPKSEGATAPPYAEIAVSGSISLDHHLDLRVQGFDRISLPPVMIGDSGVIISATDVLLSLSRSAVLPEILAAGFDESFIGVFIGELQVKLPKGLPELAPESLVIHNAAIGSGGFSGRLEADYSFTYNAATKAYSGDGAGKLFGIAFGVSKITLDMKQNAFQESKLTGEMLLPFFEKRVTIEAGFNLDGSFTARLTGVAETGDSINPSTGLCTLTKGNLFKLEIESISFEVHEGLFTTKLSGQITPLLGGLDWPSFQVKELAIDSDGNVKLEGGWLDLRDQYSFDFHGVQMEITKLGFGKTEDADKWIGFSGALKLVKDLPASTSVEGLRLIWHEDGHGNITGIDLTLKEVAVEFQKKDVIHFKGTVSYDSDKDEFHGAVKLDLQALKLQVDGALVIGKNGGHSYMAVYLDAELPSGLPLWATGLALYGMAGLFALEMEPNKRDGQPWYGISGDSWYHSGTPGVTDLAKWRNQPGSLAVGAGVTLGTLADNGYRFSGRMLLVIVFPGPILLIEGKANMLKERAKLAGEEPLFRALAVLDNRADTILIGVDARYKRNDEGKLIDIQGSAEAFFDFNDPIRGHLYLGLKDPREKRIRARIFGGLFEADAYFMLEAKQLAMGVWAGYAKKWKFGPLQVGVEAWIESNNIISWKPTHLFGSLALHGSAELAVWGFGVSLTVDAGIGADVFDPYHLLGDFSVGINLPWPLPDFHKTIPLEWGPEPVAPPLSLPLKEVAVEHFKVTTSWPLSRGTLLLPNYDADNDGFLAPPTGASEPADLGQLPVVPLDARPHLTFSRSVHDDAHVGVNDQPVFPDAKPDGWEWLGDPSKNEGPVRIRSGLQEVALEKWVGGVNPWQLVARSPAGSDETKLYGSWAPVPQLPAGETLPGTDPPAANVKLWLWSKTPFDYTSHSGTEWDEWFTDTYGHYPCLAIPPDREVCCDFAGYGPDQLIPSPWRSATDPQIELSWLAPEVESVCIFDEPVEQLNHALLFPRTLRDKQQLNEITIAFSTPVKAARVILVSKSGSRAVGFDDKGNAIGAASGGQVDNPQIEIVGENLQRIVVHLSDDTFLFGVCVIVGLSAEEILHWQVLEQHTRDELARWSQVGAVLDPQTVYRVRIVTTIETQEFPDSSFNLVRQQTESAYFRTGGPPGLTVLSVPPGSQTPEQFRSGLEDLSRYIRQTVPPTVAAEGKQPVLPHPVYRAYDVGVEFNEDYVDLMYRLARRDLGLYLYDNNNKPVRDVLGRLIVLANRWGRAEQLTLTESDQRWLTLINSSTCASLDLKAIPHARTLASTAEAQVLDPDTIYEARLVPLLLHDDFSVGLAGWHVLDEGTNEGPSHWQALGHKALEGTWATASGAQVSLHGAPDLSVVESALDVILLHTDTVRPSGLYRITAVNNATKTVSVDGNPNLSGGLSAWEIPAAGAVTQTSNIWGGSMDGRDPVKPGTMLLGGDTAWTDYRLSVILSSADDGAIGVVFRYLDAQDYYRFSVDRQRQYRCLVRVVMGVHTILAEDDFFPLQAVEHLYTVEAIGSSLRVYEDRRLVFDVSDECIDCGCVGLYCWGNTGARFSDLRIDDFQSQAPVVYRFKFTTSQFANFFHHLHSFQDESWPTPVDGALSAEALSGLLAQAVLPAASPSDSEAHAYETLAGYVLGQAGSTNPSEVQVTRVEREGKAVAFLVQSPEPIDWKRTALDILYADRRVPTPEVPGTLKLTDASLPGARNAEESVTLLLRQEAELGGHRLEYRTFPGPLAGGIDTPPLFEEQFAGSEGGLLFREEFGPNARDRYEIVDEGKELGPSAWEVQSGYIVQTSGIFGGSISATVPDKPGTMAVTGSLSWADVRIRASFRSADEDAIGVVFRYQDVDNYYRFSMDRKRSYRRLVKKVGGMFKLLWEDNTAYNLGQLYHFLIEAHGDWLLGSVDDALLFALQDKGLSTGRVGFYCWANSAAHFESLSVESLEHPLVLWKAAFQDLTEIDVVDEPEAVGEPSIWTATDGVLSQLSDIHGEPNTPDPVGTYVLAGDAAWRDVQISTLLRSDLGGALGVMFRIVPHVTADGEVQGDDYYRYTMHKDGGYRRLTKKLGDTLTVLWQDTVVFTPGQAYTLTLRAIGPMLFGYLDGVALFAVHDEDLDHGQIGFYCSANAGVRFEHVVVTDPTPTAGRWSLHDEGTIEAPSVWWQRAGALIQTSNINDGSLSAAGPVKAGTYALAGDASWEDYRLTVTMGSTDDDAIGAIFRFRDGQNYYRFSLDSQRSYRRLIKKENGVVTTLWEDAHGYDVGQPFTVVLDAVGSHLIGYVDGVRLFDLMDGAHVAGRIGLYCWGNTGARFERVEVRRPSVRAYALLRDRFAEGNLADWSFVDGGTIAAPSQWVLLDGVLRQTGGIHDLPDDRETLDKKGTHALAGDPAWTDIVVSARLQPYDKGAVGLLFRYRDEGHYYRFSMDNERQYRRLVKNVGGVFSLLWEDSSTYEVGRPYKVAVVAVGSWLRGYLDGVPMFAVQDGDLPSGGIGLYCWGNSDARFSAVSVYPATLAFGDWLLEESFQVLIPDRWRFVDEGDQEAPSQWDVTGGELRQTSGIFGGVADASTPEQPGTYALGGNPAWSDYRISVCLRTDESGAAGVMFRFQDTDNYYRFSLGLQPDYRRMVKKLRGVTTTLWEDDTASIPGRKYLLTLDCVGQQLTGYLDGIRLFAVEDDGLSAGQIGLYCWKNTGVHFAEVRVSKPDWAPYYEFSSEERLPAGTRVQILARNLADASSEELGLVRRFLDSPDQPVPPELPSYGVHLRLRAFGQDSGHSRYFLPASSYASVSNPKIIRKADGTGFFLVPPDPAGSSFSPGLYQLKLIFRRDNQALDSSSQILSQAGNRGPEVAVIDIPFF